MDCFINQFSIEKCLFKEVGDAKYLCTVEYKKPIKRKVICEEKQLNLLSKSIYKVSPFSTKKNPIIYLKLCVFSEQLTTSTDV